MEETETTQPATQHDGLPGLAIAGLASLGAGAVHAAAIGLHAEHPQLARVFVVMAALQLGVGLWAMLRGSRLVALLLAVVNAVAVGGWLVSRVSGVSWIDGLEQQEDPQFADTVCALMGLAAVVAALLVLWWARRPATSSRPSSPLWLPAVVVAGLAVAAMWTTSTHVHSHDEAAHSHGDEGDDHDHEGDDHDHEGEDATGNTSLDGLFVSTTVHEHDSNWPRPWDPAQPLDLSGVEGVSAEQQARAEELVRDTLEVLPHWASTDTAIADGYHSIGDAGTGTEHYINTAFINDEHFLDPNYPESLVYLVKGDQRILAGAMFIASARPSDDPTLTDFAGQLMTWHNHGNLCWSNDGGQARVVGVTDANGKCAVGVNTGGENPMVHVWITSHPCGPFAALEGVGAGQAAVSEEDRTDKCHADHGH